MVHYRRTKIKGGLYFFTVTLYDRRSDLLIKHIDYLRDAFKKTKQKYPFHIHAIVVLPEHLHTIWQLPQNDDDYSIRWLNIKNSFTKQLLKINYQFKKSNTGGYHLWQRRFWEHTIRNENDLLSHTHYIHYNPVKHGLVEHVEDWPYSSFHRFNSQNLININWKQIENDIQQLKISDI